MRSIVIFLALFSCVSSHKLTFKEIHAQWLHAFIGFEGDCICKSQVNELAGKALMRQWDFKDDPCLKCQTKCYAQKIGTVDSSGKFYPKIAVKKLYGVTLEIAEFCDKKAQGITDICRKVYEIGFCSATLIAASYKLTLPLPKGLFDDDND